MQIGEKRKVKSGITVSRKKTKRQHLTSSELPWKTVTTPKEAALTSDLDGILELEEVDDVEVVYEETEGGKVIRFNVIGETKHPEASSDDVELSAGPSILSGNQTAEPEVPPSDALPFDSESLLPNWHPFSLHSQLNHALHAQDFTTPTPIQSKAIPIALKGKDIVGVAETGSGKTLAFGLPILHYLLSNSNPTHLKQSKRSLKALVLAPTRELALQVSSHLNACLNSFSNSHPEVKKEDGDSALPSTKKQKKKREEKGKAKEVTTRPPKPKGPPLVSVAAIVGGMSSQKQRRVLDRGVDVLVATPGRLWDILQEDDNLANQIKTLRFLVLDEADRMIETGHFAELDNILRLTLRQSTDDEIEPPSLADNDDSNSAHTTQDKENTPIHQLQTFIFSATLSKDLQRNLKKRFRPKHKPHKKAKPASTIDDLVMRLDFRDPEPEVIDLSPEGGVVSSLKESKIDCLSGDKDAFLYYFLLRYPGRSLVFLSSIDGIRRLMPLMELLEIKAFALHSQLEQRQRLKNLDRFKANSHCVLLATDIAARGLDIPAVDHVVHYQIPRSADVYVHRNGRTARAMRDGFSLLMCAPDERRLVRALMGSVGRREDEIPEMAVELYLLDRLKARIQVARQIDSARHKIKKENHEKNWLREAAEAMEIEIDSDLGLSSDEDSKNSIPLKHQRKQTNAKTASLQAELKALLSQPLVARGVSTRYITSGSRSIVDDVIAGEYHETMLGLKKTQAGQDVVISKRKKAKKEVKEEFEEWNGISDSS